MYLYLKYISWTRKKINRIATQCDFLHDARISRYGGAWKARKNYASQHTHTHTRNNHKME